MKMERGYFQWAPEEGTSGSEIECMSNDESLVIGVTEEQAMDSYNQKFTCQIVLPRSAAERLRDWLTSVLATQ